jgi:hypothetical protein
VFPRATAELTQGVQLLGQPDQHHPQILGHGQQHLAQAFQLATDMPAVLMQFTNGVELDQPIDHVPNSGAKFVVQLW